MTPWVSFMADPSCFKNCVGFEKQKGLPEAEAWQPD
jgi:hypothetical protein